MKKSIILSIKTLLVIFIFQNSSLAALKKLPKESDNECYKYIFASLMSIDNKDLNLAEVYAEKAKNISEELSNYKLMGYSYAVCGLIFQKNFPQAMDIPGRQYYLDLSNKYLTKEKSSEKSDVLFGQIIKTIWTQRDIKIKIDTYKELLNLLKLESPSFDSEFKLFFLRNFSKDFKEISESLQEYGHFIGESMLLKARHHVNQGLISYQLFEPIADQIDSNINLQKAMLEFHNVVVTTGGINIPYQSPELFVLEDILSSGKPNYQSKIKTSPYFDSNFSSEGFIYKSIPPGCNGTMFAAIEIGASGVKFSIICEKTIKSGDYAYNFLKTDNVDTKFGDFNETSLNLTYETVKRYYDSATIGYKIPKEQIFIVFSSGANDRSVRKHKEVEVLNLSNTLTQNLSIPNIRSIEVLSVKEEARLTLLGIVTPNIRQKLYTAALVDIGTGNVKGGFCNSDNQRCNSSNFTSFNSEWGLKNIMESVTQFPDLSTPQKAQQYADEVRKFIKEKPLQEINQQLQDNGLLSKREIFLTGGIFWAIATLTHPEDVVTNDSIHIKLTLNDVQNFLRLAINNYPTNPQNYSDKINAEIRDITSGPKFPQPKAIVGGILAEEILLALQKSPDKKTYYYSKYSVVGWPTGYIIKSITPRF